MAVSSNDPEGKFEISSAGEMGVGLLNWIPACKITRMLGLFGFSQFNTRSRRIETSVLNKFSSLAWATCLDHISAEK